MPTVTLNKKRVLKLAQVSLTDKELKERIPYLGTDLEDVTDNEIIVEIFPNRPDLLSEEGFARALSSFLGKNEGYIRYFAKSSDYVVNITKEVKEIRPFTACAVIKNLKFDKQILNDVIEIQEKLHTTYGRNRKKCAIGIYPMEVISWPITYTALPPNKIKFIPLDKTQEMTATEILQKHEKGKEYACLLENKKKYPLFVDAKNEVLSMPPIINSEKTGKVSFETSEIFVECSGFEFHTVSKALNMLIAAFEDMGGTSYQVTLNYEDENPKKIITPELEPEKMILENSYVEKYLGLGLTDKQIASYLKKMGFEAVIKNKGELIVLIPSYRADIIHPIDLIEDVAIGYGFENIGSSSKRIYTTGKETYEEKVKRKLREILVGHGLIETNNFSLYNLKEQKKLLPKKADLFVKVINSVSSEYNSLRENLMIVLLKTIKNNKHYEYPQKIFEIGTTFRINKLQETKVEESDSLAVILCSEKSVFTDARKILDSLFSALNIEYHIKKDESDLYMKGRTGSIFVKGKNIGKIGEISPFTLEHFELEIPSCGFEIKLKHVIEALKEINEII